MFAPHATATRFAVAHAVTRHPRPVAPAIASAPAGSSIGARVLEHVLQRRADGVGVHAHDLVHQLSRTRRKVSLPTCFTATPSANRPTMRERHPAAGLAPSAPSRRSPSGCTPITLIVGAQALHVRRDARDEPAAADRDEDRVYRLRAMPQDLDRDRALAGDHVRVVVGMNEGRRPTFSAASASACS